MLYEAYQNTRGYCFLCKATHRQCLDVPNCRLICSVPEKHSFFKFTQWIGTFTVYSDYFLCLYGTSIVNSGHQMLSRLSRQYWTELKTLKNSFLNYSLTTVWAMGSYMNTHFVQKFNSVVLGFLHLRDYSIFLFLSVLVWLYWRWWYFCAPLRI